MIFAENLMESHRKKQGLSQTGMANRMGISRARLQRMEKKTFSDLTWEEWKLLRSVLGDEWDVMTRMMMQRASLRQPEIQRYSLEKPAFKIVISPEVSLSVLADSSDQQFAGCFLIAPGAELPSSWLPRTDQVFWLVVEGQIQMTLPGASFLLKAGDRKSVNGYQCLSLKNSDSKNEAKCLLLTAPSFIRIIR